MSNTTNCSGLARALPFVLATISAALLLTSLRLPLWHMRLEAPQYQGEEALKVTVFPNKYDGAMREIGVLNQYIGVHVPARLPQFDWLPLFLAGSSALAFAAGLVGPSFRRAALLLASSIITAGILAAAAQAKTQMHDIGHKRDHRTVLAGVQDFTPPFLGTGKIAQFTVTSRLGLGSWLIASAIALQFTGAWISRKPFQASTNLRSQREATGQSPETDRLAYQI
jgi:hypothetical protein